MKEVKFTNRESQKDSLAIEVDTVGYGCNILIATGDDKFGHDWADWDIDDTDNYLHAIDLQVANCFEFGEYEGLDKPSDLVGKSISIHDGSPIYPEEEITEVIAIYKVKDYFPYDELIKEGA
jgi:hypothetical protein